MRNWQQTEISVGDVKEGTTATVVFKGTPELPEIMEFKAGCPSCTSYRFDRNSRQLSVSISLGKIPVHLRMADKGQGFRKQITVTYFDRTKDVLVVSGSKVMK